MIGNTAIGLDVGTQAVRAVELSLGRGRPVVRRIAQVGLPVGAVVAGEVMDMPAVSAALRRLWKEGGFTSHDVVVGVANSRVVARVVDLPAMPDAELRSSLRWQVQDLIPIPVDDAELDIQVLERPDEDAKPDARVKALLIAAHRDMLRSLLAALEGASLRATRIDLVPFALVRALSQPESWLADDGGNYEVIVGSGAGVTNVVVHQHGVAQFVRSLPTGGSAVTEALADDLGIEVASAESLKRAGATTSTESARAEIVASDTLVPLASDVAGSLDFHLAELGRANLRRVVLSGGGVRLHALRHALEDQLTVEVVDGDPFATLDVSKCGVDEATLDGFRDLFGTAVGLALAGRTSEAISLLPSDVQTQRAERRQMMTASAGVGVFAALLVGLAFARGTQVDGARAAATKAEARATATQAKVGALSDVEKLQSEIATGRETAVHVLQSDVDWPAMLRDVATVIPNDVWLSSFHGERDAITGVTELQMIAEGPSQTAGAKWLLRMADLDQIDDAWLSSARKNPSTGIVEFTTSANVPSGQATRRVAKFSGDDK